jgi:MFS family permease
MPCNGGRSRPTLAFVGFLVGLDASLTPLVLPEIRLEFGEPAGSAVPMVAYVLGATIAAPLFAQLQDRHGRQTMSWIAIGLFVLGAGLSGLGHDLVELFAARLIQGVGGGGLLAMALAGRWGLVGTAFGLLVGPWLGALLPTSLNWRWAFVLELGLGIAAFAASALARHERQGNAGVDAPGTILLASLSSCTVLVATFAGGSANGLMIAGLLAAVSLLVGSLIFVESHIAAPLLPPSLLREPHHVGRLVLAACLGFGGLAALTFGPVDALGMTAITGPLVLAAVAANEIRLFGRWPAAIGGAVFAMGSAMGWGGTAAHFPIIALLLQGLGLGVTAACLGLSAAGETPRRGAVLFALFGGLIGVSLSGGGHPPWGAMTVVGAVMLGLACLTPAISPRGQGRRH